MRDQEMPQEICKKRPGPRLKPTNIARNGNRSANHERNSKWEENPKPARLEKIKIRIQVLSPECGEARTREDIVLEIHPEAFPGSPVENPIRRSEEDSSAHCACYKK